MYLVKIITKRYDANSVADGFLEYLLWIKSTDMRKHIFKKYKKKALKKNQWCIRSHRSKCLIFRAEYYSNVGNKGILKVYVIALHKWISMYIITFMIISHRHKITIAFSSRIWISVLFQEINSFVLSTFIVSANWNWRRISIISFTQTKKWQN